MGRCAPNALLAHQKTPMKGAPNSTTKQHEIEPMPCFTVTFSSMRAPDDDYPHSPFIDVPNRKIRQGGIWPGMCRSYALPGRYSTHTHQPRRARQLWDTILWLFPALGKLCMKLVRLAFF